MSVETGKQRETGWIPREKYPEFPFESPKKKKNMGEKSTTCFLLIFFWGEEDLSNFAGEMLLCCYDRILIQISKFLRCIFHVFVAQGEVRVVQWYILPKKTVARFRNVPGFQAKVPFPDLGGPHGAQKKTQTVC